MTKKILKSSQLSLPALRGRMGDWFYYVTLMSFREIADRVKLPIEIDKYKKDELKLGEWIQRDLEPSRIEIIAKYLKKQKQRFFNSLILGLYEGEPVWQDLNISFTNEFESINEKTVNYFNRTFGILTLSGEESIFAIDGQHRAKGIREAVKESPKLLEEEISVIFVAHKTDELGKIRTRRLFSTLNRYAKPVNKREIIALSEDNNCAIVTRELIESFNLLDGKILIHATRVIRPENKSSFTNIIVLYDIVERLLTNRKIVGIKVKGNDFKSFTTERADPLTLMKSENYIKKIFKEVFDSIPSLNEFAKNGEIDRTLKQSSLLFRPIGQNILFDVLKVSISKNKKNAALTFFAKDDFNLLNQSWKKVFWDEETATLITEKSRQRFATLLILEKLGVQINRTKKDKEIYDSFNITVNDI